MGTGAKSVTGLYGKAKVQSIKGQADMAEQLAEVYGSTAAENTADTVASSTADTVAGTTAVTAAGSTVSERIVTQTALDGNTVTGNTVTGGTASGDRDAAAESRPRARWPRAHCPGGRLLKVRSPMQHGKNSWHTAI